MIFASRVEETKHITMNYMYEIGGKSERVSMNGAIMTMEEIAANGMAIVWIL